MTVHAVSRRLPWSCEQLFDLAASVESYPDFIPGWNDVRVLERHEGHLRVEQCLGLGPLQHCFISDALLERPYRVTVSSTTEPFRNLLVDWRFEPAGNACMVALRINLETDNALLETAAGTLFALTADDIIERFEQRARTLYGRAPDRTKK